MTREIHVWETYEICLRAKETYENPYTDVVVWAVLYGPDFHKKVYEGYMTICEKYADRITKIDASKSIDEVASQVIDIIKKII